MAKKRSQAARAKAKGGTAEHKESRPSTYGQSPPLFTQSEIEERITLAFGPQLAAIIGVVFAERPTRKLHSGRHRKVAAPPIAKKKAGAPPGLDGRRYGRIPPKAPISPRPKSRKR